MSDSYSPGQELTITVTETPLRTADRKTVANLMRHNLDHRRALSKAHRHRMRTLVVRSRGKRPWEVRVKSAKIVRPDKGATWTMTYFPHIAPELRAVSRFLDIKAA